ncbi:MAG: hypothetical protein HUK23_05780 [Sphaerochaetaceae bacterium]|nr:hypothetical protein [Sphaerochaetaceae bacterium]
MQRKIIIALLFLVLLSVLLLFVLLGCSQEQNIGEIVNSLAGKDYETPTLVSVNSASSQIVMLEFSEPVKIYGSSFEPFVARSDGKYVYVTLNSSLQPGTQSKISGRVSDYSGNTTGFSVNVWGFNPLMPKLLINELTTKGTDKSPCRTELKVLEDGNVNGLTLYCGIPDDNDCKFVFGDVDVKKGDFIVVWWTEKIPDNADANCLNFCAQSSERPATNNGAQVLCDTPSLGAHILDAVLYSNFSASHEGYGTKAASQRASWVISAGAWEGIAIDSTSSTATRSMSRNLNGQDTNKCNDWFVTVTSGATFGLDNTSQAY